MFCSWWELFDNDIWGFVSDEIIHQVIFNKNISTYFEEHFNRFTNLAAGEYDESY